MNINRQSPIPLYYQLKQIFTQKLNQSLWRPGDKLPTEEEIHQDYGVSRTTVRQALRELELEGRITRQAGRGTFVSQPKVREGTEPFKSTIAEIQADGIELGWKLISADWEPVPDQIAARISVPSGSQAFCLRRLRLANNEPIGMVVSYVPKEFSDKIDLEHAEDGGSMNYLKGTELDKCDAERIVEALPAEREEAEILQLERREPVLVITRVVRNCDAQPIEYFRGVYRGDRFQYHIQNLPAQT